MVAQPSTPRSKVAIAEQEDAQLIDGCARKGAANRFNDADLKAELGKLVAWLEEEDFLITVCEWAWQHCREFPADTNVLPSQVEHPLHFTELHKQYRDLFEARVKTYVEGVLRLSDDEFLAAAAKLLKE